MIEVRPSFEDGNMFLRVFSFDEEPRQLYRYIWDKRKKMFLGALTDKKITQIIKGVDDESEAGQKKIVARLPLPHPIPSKKEKKALSSYDSSEVSSWVKFHEDHLPYLQASYAEILRQIHFEGITHHQLAVAANLKTPSFVRRDNTALRELDRLIDPNSRSPKKMVIDHQHLLEKLDVEYANYLVMRFLMSKSRRDITKKLRMGISVIEGLERNALKKFRIIIQNDDEPPVSPSGPTGFGAAFSPILIVVFFSPA